MTPVLDASSTSTDKQGVMTALYGLASKLARARNQRDSVKETWANEKIASLRSEVMNENRVRLLNSFGKMDFPGYHAPTNPHSENIQEVVAKLLSALRNGDKDFVYSFKSLVQLPPVIHHMKGLQSLSFERANLTSVPLSIFELPFLRRISLFENRLVTLPPFGGSPLLEHISVQGNKLTALPDDIGSLSLLESLQAERNCIQTFPVSLSMCTRLSYVNVCANRISYIPPEMARLTGLTWFTIGKNPVRNVPPEVSASGTSAVLAHLKRTSETSLGFGPMRDMEEDLMKAAADTKFSDIAFKPRAARSPILCHRVFIAARCPKLYTYVLQLEMGLAENSDGTPKPPPAKDDQGRSIIPLNDMDTATFELLKQWIYHDSFKADIPVIKPLVPGASFEDEQVHQQAVAQASRVLSRIRKVADHYSISGLIKKIEAAQGIPESVTAALRLPPDVPFCESFHSLLNRPELSDTTFLVDGDTIHAHKVILSSRAIFFEGMFQAGMEESHTGKVTVPGLSKAVLWSILVYCYRGEVLMGGDYALDLLTGARLCGLSKLASDVTSAIAYSLDLENAGSIYQFAIDGKYDTLAELCVQFALNNCHELACVQESPESTFLANVAAKRIKEAEA